MHHLFLLSHCAWLVFLSLKLTRYCLSSSNQGVQNSELAPFYLMSWVLNRIGYNTQELQLEFVEFKLEWQEEEFTKLYKWCIQGNEGFFHPGRQRLIISFLSFFLFLSLSICLSISVCLSIFWIPILHSVWYSLHSNSGIYLEIRMQPWQERAIARKVFIVYIPTCCALCLNTITLLIKWHLKDQSLITMSVLLRHNWCLQLQKPFLMASTEDNKSWKAPNDHLSKHLSNTLETSSLNKEWIQASLPYTIKYYV